MKQSQENSNILNFYISANLFGFASGLIGVFLNLFLLATYNYISVLYFQIIGYLVVLIVYILAGYLLKKYDPKQLYVLGLLILVLLFVMILGVRGPFSNALVFGVIWGVGSGIFWAGSNIIMYDILQKANKTSFVAMNNLIGGIVSLVAPLLAGVLIQLSNLPSIYKFFWDFALTCVFLVFSAFFILRIKKEGSKRYKDFSIQKTIIKARKGYLAFKLYFLLDQLFVVPFWIILPIYVFQLTSSYTLTGIFESYLIFLTIITNLLFKNGFKENGKFVMIAVAGIILSSVTLLPNLIPPPINVVVYATIYTILSTPLDNAAYVKFLQFLDKNKDINRVLFWANREYYLAIGRVGSVAIMIALIAFLLSNSQDLILLMPVLSLYSFVYLYIIKGSFSGPILFIRNMMPSSQTQ